MCPATYTVEQSYLYASFKLLADDDSYQPPTFLTGYLSLDSSQYLCYIESVTHIFTIIKLNRFFLKANDQVKCKILCVFRSVVNVVNDICFFVNFP